MVLKKKREKASFWTAIFWMPEDLPSLAIDEFTLQTTTEIEVVARKSTADRLARCRLKELNAEMLHPEDRLWRYRLVELKGGKR